MAEAKTQAVSGSTGRSLVVTQGDPDGVGPELIVEAMGRGLLRPGDVVVADSAVIERHLSRLSGERRSQAEALWQATQDPWAREAGVLGQFAALERGVDLVEAKAGRALVTAPIDKARASSEGLRHPGHTEYLAARAGVDEFAMLMAGGSIRVALATIHIPLAEVTQRLRVEDVVSVAKLLARALHFDFGYSEPRVGILGVNPHAGEGGLFGDEEQSILGPALEALSAFRDACGFPCEFIGPIPADTAFTRNVQGEFAGLVAMYHDQGLGPFKLKHFSDGVNMTLGLPYVRTSPDHGTAMDIAGRGLADPSSFVAAIEIARGRD